MEMSDILELVEKAEKSSTTKPELKEIALSLAKMAEEALRITPKETVKEDPKSSLYKEALERCAKKELSITARRALKEIG